MPISGSHGKYATKFKSWKVARFLRKHSDTPLHMLKKQDVSVNLLDRGDIVQSSNGYHQVPTVVESQDNRLGLPPVAPRVCLQRSSEIASFEEIIDIRSYLSQSRSNMSPFGRSSSYRSQYGRPNTVEVIILPRCLACV